MLYPDEFLETFTTDPISATKTACNLALAELKSGARWTTQELESIEEAHVLMSELQTAKVLPTTYTPAAWDYDASRIEQASIVVEALRAVLAQCETLELKARKEALATRIRIGLGTRFSYMFAPADLERIQTLLNELRDHVSKSKHFEADHQRRILARLESLQSELHKRMSDLDRFWGLIGEAGVVMAKLGNDAKPIVDRVKEIADIVWNTQSRSERLPSSAKSPQIGYESSETDNAQET